MKKNILLLGFFVLLGIVANAQKSKLASQYFRNGEYEKSAELYKSLYKKNKYNNSYFTYYFKSLLEDERYEDAIKAIDFHLKKRPSEIQFIAWKGYLYEKLDKKAKAKKLYEKAIKKAKVENFQLVKLGNVFRELMKYDLAEKTYKKGLESKKYRIDYLYYIGDLYAVMGESEKMTNYFLQYIGEKEKFRNLNSIKNRFSLILDEKEFESLKSKLIKSIQNNPDNINLIDLLGWVYLKTGDYKKAMRQIIAIDRRFEEDGKRVYRFALDAKKAGESMIAAKSFQYIVENKNNRSPYYFSSIKNYLFITKEVLENDTTATKSDFIEIENQYNKFLKQYGIGDLTFNLVLELANLEVNNLHDPDKGIEVLKNVIGRKNLDRQNIARAKILLGDFYLVKGEIWEASLLYSQVDKRFKEGELGELARFKNGQLYYYNGDFEWAQTIFNILKPATSKKISNDAIELSVFISETVGEDSTMVKPLKIFSKAELLIYQNRYEEALSALDSINYLYPDNNLEDDVWYVKAHIFKKEKKIDLAIDMYDKILKKYPDELKADNSLFELADIYERIIKDRKKAMQLYEKLFLDYPNSTLAVEARKKYRKLDEERLLQRAFIN
jgi:tetratricopeptide (TPR) repeat protein